RRHGFIDAVEPPKKGKKGPAQSAPVKECPRCNALVPIMKHVCDCGFEFPIAERENETLAHVGAIISTEVQPMEMKVDRVRYARHMGKSGVPTLRVDYICGLRIISEYVCIEHAGYARTKAISWWDARCENPFARVPVSVDDALTMADDLLAPEQIVVSFAAKFPEIKRHVFSVEKTAA
ncbi:MAG: hypothetical protein ACO3RW_10455, partial [Burkholderiaceae bacterium]